MRFAAVAVGILAAAPAAAGPTAPGWTDVPAMLDAAIAPHADALRACAGPRTLSLEVTRDRKGRTYAGMPLLGLGQRGPTREERCLVKAIARIALPPLPTGIDRVALAYELVAAGAPPAKHEKRFDDWRDPAATIATVVQARLDDLAACDRKPRTVRFVFDRVKERTRIWLPAWQFHSTARDGTTPPRERRIKDCLTRTIRDWSAPVLPFEMGELQVSVRTTP
jgi:hypothetical protein